VVRLGGVLVPEEKETVEAWPIEIWRVSRHIFDARDDFDHVRDSFDTRICYLRQNYAIAGESDFTRAGRAMRKIPDLK